MFGEIFWVALGAIGGLLAGIPALVDMLGRIADRRSRTTGTPVRPPPSGTAGRFPVRLAAGIGAVLLILSGGVIAYRAGLIEWLRGPNADAGANLTAAPEACDGAAQGPKVATTGRWKGKRVTWDIYADGTIDAGNGLTGSWHVNGDRFVAEFSDKTHAEGEIIGRTLCGTRFKNGRESGIFWLDRTSYKLPPIESPSPAPSKESPVEPVPAAEPVVTSNAF